MGRHIYVSALLHLIKPSHRRHIAPSTPRGRGGAAGSRRVGRHAPQQGGWVGRVWAQQQIISVGRIATPIGTGTVRLRGGNRSPRGSGWVGRARD